LTLKIQLKNIEIELLNLEGISSKAEIKKCGKTFQEHALQKLPFDEFSRFVSGETEGEKFDIIFDTAPTGHTYDYLNCLLLGQVLQMKILMAFLPGSNFCTGKKDHTVVSRLRDASLTSFIS
jgi:anion-transporting  ArsA/GET3 family ATPase